MNDNNQMSDVPTKPQLLLDDVPVIAHRTTTIELDEPQSDKNHFCTIFGTDYGDEFAAISHMQSLSIEGESIVRSLYSLRGCARAIPIVSDLNYEKKDQVHVNTFHVLRPHIVKISKLVSYQKRLVQCISRSIDELRTPERYHPIIPDSLYQSLVHLIDLVVKLDHLKDMKTSLQNDFSFYKRSFQNARNQLETGEENLDEEIHNIQMFLCNPQYTKYFIFCELRDSVHKISGFDSVVLNLLSYCSSCLLKEWHLLSDEKFGFVRVMVHLLWLLDKEGLQPQSNILRANKASIDKAVRILKAFPVVPIFAEMSLKPFDILMKTSYFSSLKEKQPKQINNPISTWFETREQSENYVPRIAQLLTKIPSSGQTSGLDSAALSEEVHNTVVEGIKLLSKWKYNISEQLAWKYQHPIKHETLEKLGVELDHQGIDYSCVLRYNCSKEELSALVDSICAIKSVAAIFNRSHGQLASMLRFHVHDEVQKFCQHSLLPMIHRADKKKKRFLPALINLRSLAADWSGGVEPSDDFKARKQDRKYAEYGHRYVATSYSQLEVLRISIQSLLEDQTLLAQSSFFGRADLDSSDISILQSFYERSFYYRYLLDFKRTLIDLSDLSDVWCREFYLEMTKCVQFPIDMSLPWMLAEHVILNPFALSSNLMEALVFIMDIYNDMSDRSLREFHQQFLFDEVEAEANLCFDQLVYLISDQIYGHYKDMAAFAALDTMYLSRMGEIRGDSNYRLRKMRYESVLKQRHVQILGRCVDLNSLIAKHINEKISKDIEIALQKLEASAELCYIIEFERLVKVIELTHERLSRFLNLDEFAHIRREAEESKSPSPSSLGRVALYVLHKIMNDLIPNFSFNAVSRRFLRAPIGYGEAPSKDSAPKSIPENFLFGSQYRSAFELQSRLFRGFIGQAHVECVFRVLDAAELVSLICECHARIEIKIRNVLSVCIQPLWRALPPASLPKFLYKTGGCYGYFEGKLKTLSEYELLKPQVFQCFREIGNTLAFLHMLDDVQRIGGILNWGLHGAAETCGRSEPTRNKFCCLSEAILKIGQTIDSTGVREEWSSKKSKVDMPFHKCEGGKFNDVWNALAFLFCMPMQRAPPGTQRCYSLQEEFGDGFTWAGCTILHVLNLRYSSELRDYSNHILAIEEDDQAASRRDSPVGQRRESAMVGDIDAAMAENVEGFLVAAKRTARIKSTVFHLLNHLT